MDGASLPVVSALCHAWLQRSRRHCSPAVCVDPVAAAVDLLLPAPISGPIESWGVQPHQSSSGWMTTWRVWRTVASALHMSGILSPALGNTDVTHAALLLACSFPTTHACGRVVDLESCITVWFLINNASMCEVMMQLQVCVHKRIIVQICCMRFDGFLEGQFSSAPWNMGGGRPRALHCFTNACHSFFCLFWLEPKYRKS